MIASINGLSDNKLYQAFTQKCTAVGNYGCNGWNMIEPDRQ